MPIDEQLTRILSDYAGEISMDRLALPLAGLLSIYLDKALTGELITNLGTEQCLIIREDALAAKPIFRHDTISPEAIYLLLKLHADPKKFRQEYKRFAKKSLKTNQSPNLYQRIMDLLEIDEKSGQHFTTFVNSRLEKFFLQLDIKFPRWYYELLLKHAKQNNNFTINKLATIYNQYIAQNDESHPITYFMGQL